MEAREKARELMQRFNEPTQQWDELDGFIPHKHNAKTCALIVVDEIFQILEDDENIYVLGHSSYIDFWQEVKQEIEKL